MKTILDKKTRDELIDRIHTLSEKNIAQWGSMNVYQMIKHCVAWEDMIARKQKFRQTFPGRLFGKIALRSMIGNDNPLKHNMPTLPELKITASTCDIESEKSKWIALIEKNALDPNSNFVHPFLGKMTVEEIGLLAYKHNDHHLRQFNS
jgi:hypothetical protein